MGSIVVHMANHETYGLHFVDYKKEDRRVIWNKDEQERDLYFVRWNPSTKECLLIYEARGGQIQFKKLHVSQLRRPWYRRVIKYKKIAQ